MPTLSTSNSLAVSGDAERAGQGLAQRAHECIPLVVSHDVLCLVVRLETLVNHVGHTGATALSPLLRSWLSATFGGFFLAVNMSARQEGYSEH